MIDVGIAGIRRDGTPPLKFANATKRFAVVGGLFIEREWRLAFTFVPHERGFLDPIGALWEIRPDSLGDVHAALDAEMNKATDCPGQTAADWFASAVHPNTAGLAHVVIEQFAAQHADGAPARAEADTRALSLPSSLRAFAARLARRWCPPAPEWQALGVLPTHDAMIKSPDGPPKAPFNGRVVDILARSATPRRGIFHWRRFADCTWMWEGERFDRVPDDWKPIYWIAPPEWPAGVPTVSSLTAQLIELRDA